MTADRPLRIIFMGTPAFAVPALVTLKTHHTIVGVFTQPDRPVGRGQKVRFSPVKEKALELGLPIFQPLKLTDSGIFELLSGLKPDVIVVAAYGQILKSNILNLAPLGCVNIHSSLLPRWRGAAPIQWAILEGDAESGITTMEMAAKLDAGRILLQERVPITAQTTAESLHDALAKMGGDLILKTLQGLLSKTISAKPQDESLVTYAAKLEKDMQWLNCNDSVIVLDRKVRALNPWPGASIKVDMGSTERLKILSARPHQGPGFCKRGAEIFEKAGLIQLGASDGALELLKVQWEGKRPMNMAEFVSGLNGRGQNLPIRVN